MVIETYEQLAKEFKKIGCGIYHFRKNIVLHNFARGYELEVSREFFPKKANQEQLTWLYNTAIEMNKEHEIVNYKIKL